MGPGQRAPEGVTRYRLGAAAATRRARAAALVRALTALAPVLLAAELLPRLGLAPTAAFWAITVALVALVVVRAVVQFGTTKRRLASLVVTLNDDAIVAETPAEALTIARVRVARIVEVDGPLGGIRVESEPDGATGVVLVASLPRGGDGFGEVRARLELWRAIERRTRRGAGVRLLLGVAVVGAMFFLPFVLDDFVARSKLLASVLVLVTWAAIRWTMRGR